MGPRTLTDRIIARIQQAECAEPNPHLQCDYHIAWLTALYAWRGDAIECSPHVLASYEVLGLHPDKVWPAIMAGRKAQLGAEYSDIYDEAGNLKPDFSPKKPPHSVTVDGKRRIA